MAKRATKKRSTKAVPLAPPPSISLSRKRARQVTTLFHKYTRQRDLAATAEDEQKVDSLIQQMGGRREYQRASQISTYFHSTSKWVLGCLSRNGWLHGIAVDTDKGEYGADEKKIDESLSKDVSNRTRRKPERRPTRLLEVGAINTELINAASATVLSRANGEGDRSIVVTKQKYRLEVRAIDLHSTHEGIEEADFLLLPLNSKNVDDRYDVIVCSMVLNCVTTSVARGEMLSRLFHFLRPGGLVYLTIPKTCLNLSPYIDKERFEQLLQAVGLEVVEHAKDTPKVAFFVCKRPEALAPPVQFDSKWTTLAVIRLGKKYKNEFAITVTSASVLGQNVAHQNAE